MTRHLKPVERATGRRRLESRREIDEWIAERYRTLMALLEAERDDQDGQLELDLGEAA